MWGLYYELASDFLKIQKFRRMAGYTAFYCFSTLISFAFCNTNHRAGYSGADQFYAAYPAGTELLVDTGKLYKAALGNVYEEDEWGPIEWSILAKHFDRQGNSAYAYHAAFDRVSTGLVRTEACFFFPLVIFETQQEFPPAAQERELQSF